MVIEENHTRAEKQRALTGRNRTYKSRIPRVTNVHSLWKTLSAVILRRSKKGFGADLVPKTVHPVRIVPGSAQLAVYGWHVKNAPVVTKEGKPMDKVVAVLAQLNNLRMAALCPDTPLLSPSPAELEIEPTTALQPRRSWSDQTPKQIACLKLIVEMLNRGEQVAVISPFTHFTRALHARLVEAEVSSVLLDGDTPAAERGLMRAIAAGVCAAGRIFTAGGGCALQRRARGLRVRWVHRSSAARAGMLCDTLRGSLARRSLRLRNPLPACVACSEHNLNSGTLAPLNRQTLPMNSPTEEPADELRKAQGTGGRTMKRERCTCDKPGGVVVFIQWPSSVKPTKVCTHTLREFHRRHGPGTFRIVKP